LFVGLNIKENVLQQEKRSLPLGREASGLQGLCKRYKGKDVSSLRNSLFPYTYNISIRYLV